MDIKLPDPKSEAQRLLSDPTHLRRKAAYIREQAARGGPLTEQRLARAADLEKQAEELTAN